MIEFKLILLLIIAHLISDFMLQPQSWSNIKERKLISSFHFIHVLIVGILSYILSFDPGFWWAAIILTIIHLLTDILKSLLILRNQLKDYFFLDQLIHLATISGVVLAYSNFHGINFIIDIDLRTIGIITGFIFCAKPSNVLIKYILKSFSIETPTELTGYQDEKGLPNAGKLIGIVERYLALTLILQGQFEAVGLIIAAKSILRFSGTQKSEYVLVGTLLSFSIAIFSGILINVLS